jgi:hypothetical protein
LSGASAGKDCVATGPTKRPPGNLTSISEGLTSL